MKRFIFVFLCVLAFAFSASAYAAVANFEDLSLAPYSYWNGSDGSGGFISGDAYFLNSFTDWGGGFTSWDGWAYSNMTDTTTPGYTNQYSAITGGGAGGSANYGIAYDGGSYGGASPPNTSFGAVTGEDYDTTISGAYFTNTTYVYLSMRDGDGWVTAFDSGDWQKMIITGIDSSGAPTSNTVELFLADYTSANPNDWYILDEWTWVDMTGLGDIIGFEIAFAGSQADFVPSYAAMDDLTGSPVPIPGSLLLLGSGLLGLIGIRRKK
ncbi:MAG: DUF4465 domain-containing protein [Deltaproteobacteria bacterium]|nr:DUF4465 domain-containing protein [Deltaproteobacteria bacterium]